MTQEVNDKLYRTDSEATGCRQCHQNDPALLPHTKLRLLVCFATTCISAEPSRGNCYDRGCLAAATTQQQKGVDSIASVVVVVILQQVVAIGLSSCKKNDPVDMSQYYSPAGNEG